MEWFIDTFLLATHSHYVTIMPRDMNTLKILRLRYDNLVHPNMDFIDDQLKEILLVPLARKPKPSGFQIEEMTEDDMHGKTTRENKSKKENLLRVTK